MKISKRLKLIASLVDKKANVIDVGCDHALLDIFLTLNNENKCLASDININALKLLRKEIIKLGFYIDDEEVINDKKIYYVIIKFKKGRKKYNNNNDYIIGPILKNKEQSKEYYQYLLDVNNKIIKHLPRKYIKQRYILKKVNKLYKNYL